MENPCMINSWKKHQFICCLNSGPFKMMPQSTLFWFFFGEVVGWGRRKLLSIERQEETHTCLKLIPPTHNHETHQRKKKKKKSKQHVNTLSKAFHELWILLGQLFNPFYTSFACLHVKHVSKTPPSPYAHSHMHTHTHFRSPNGTTIWVRNQKRELSSGNFDTSYITPNFRARSSNFFLRSGDCF
jgi:hypothetical protein